MSNYEPKPTDCTCSYPEFVARNVSGHAFNCPAHIRLMKEFGTGTKLSELPAKSVTVLRCARCGKDHHELPFKRFQRGILDGKGVEWNYWATCPDTGDPILMKMTEVQVAGV